MVTLLTLPSTVGRYRKAYKNWLKIMIDMVRKKYSITVRLRNGNTYVWPSTVVYFYSVFSSKQISEPSISVNLDMLFTGNREKENECVRFKYKNADLTLYDAVYNGRFPAIFLEGRYASLNVHNEIVIDVGTNIGDSAIYFALNGARKVIALEPYPYSYNTAKKNVKINKLDAVIEVLNAGYGKDGFITIDPLKKTDPSSVLVSYDGGERVRIFSLKKLIQEYNIDSAVIKMNCEGCEYNIIDEDIETLKIFKEFLIAYHHGHKELENKLKEAGFNVTFRSLQPNCNKSTTKTHMRTGLLYARNKENID
ncbi:MAG: FkbM family methyltransferase [Thermoplasmata archaeon]